MAEILIIDDDADVREVMSAALEGAGHRVREAKDGSEGLALARKHHPAVVVTDMVMPEREGGEVIRQLRKEKPEIAILAVSGAVRSALYLHIAEKLGADSVLAKPFSFEALVSAVANLMNQKQRGCCIRRTVC